MKRKIIEIDREKCNGCGLCVTACHEGAIGMEDGKAKLMRDDYCDGLGDCLPACPVNAISFVEREAAPYDEAAVKANMEKKKAGQGCPGTQIRQFTRGSRGAGGNEEDVTAVQTAHNHGVADLPCGCPGTHSKQIDRKRVEDKEIKGNQEQSIGGFSEQESRLMQWPVQIKLVPVNAPYFNGANLLVAADCTAYAYAAFHERFIKNHITLIGCPKLDMTEYSAKLTEIIKNNNIKSVKIVRMEVPCCGGIESAAKEALQKSGKFIPWQVFTVTTDGHIIE